MGSIDYWLPGSFTPMVISGSQHPLKTIIAFRIIMHLWVNKILVVVLLLIRGVFC